MVAARDLQVVVREADGAECQRREHGDPDVGVGQVGPQQRRHDRRRQDQQSAHRRRAGLRAMALGTLVADHLPDLELAQLADQHAAEREADDQRGDARCRRPERDVPRDVEDRERVVQPKQEVVQHQRAPSVSACTTASMRTPREPLTSTASPSRTRLRASDAAGGAVGDVVHDRTNRPRWPHRPGRARPTHRRQRSRRRRVRRPPCRTRRGSASLKSPSSSISPSIATCRPGTLASVCSARVSADGLEL